MSCSLIIIVKGRAQQLKNVLESVAQSTVIPNDIQIVIMGEDNEYSFLQDVSLPIEVHTLHTSATLPLAAARNTGARAARTDLLFFLDVDCIVHPELFETMIREANPQTILSAYPLYLPYLPEHGTFTLLESDALQHPDRVPIPHGTAVDFKKFWSLIFCIHTSTFEAVGGFDESFVGYGGEDTDFAHSFDKEGYTLTFSKTYVLHQWHKKYSPPLNHLDDILINARRYRQKWGAYAMFSWLKEFEHKGLIRIENNEIIKLRNPTNQEVASSQSNDPY